MFASGLLDDRHACGLALPMQFLPELYAVPGPLLKLPMRLSGMTMCKVRPTKIASRPPRYLEIYWASGRRPGGPETVYISRYRGVLKAVRASLPHRLPEAGRPPAAASGQVERADEDLARLLGARQCLAGDLQRRPVVVREGGGAATTLAGRGRWWPRHGRSVVTVRGSSCARECAHESAGPPSRGGRSSPGAGVLAPRRRAQVHEHPFGCLGWAGLAAGWRPHLDMAAVPKENLAPIARRHRLFHAPDSSVLPGDTVVWCDDAGGCPLDAAAGGRPFDAAAGGGRLAGGSRLAVRRLDESEEGGVGELVRLSPPGTSLGLTQARTGSVGHTSGGVRLDASKGAQFNGARSGPIPAGPV